MYATVIIGVLIAVYVGYLVIKKFKDVKEGNYCGHCSVCPSAKSCRDFREDNVEESESGTS